MGMNQTQEHKATGAKLIWHLIRLQHSQIFQTPSRQMYPPVIGPWPEASFACVNPEIHSAKVGSDGASFTPLNRLEPVGELGNMNDFQWC